MSGLALRLTGTAPRLLPVLSAFVLLAGCASWRKQGVGVFPPAKVRVAILPLDLDFPAKRPEDLASIASSSMTASQRIAEAAAMKARLRETLTDAFETRFSSSYVFTPVPRADVDAALAELRRNSSTTFSPQQYRQLARRLHADAVLSVRVHGYGRIKASWLWLLWSASFIEGGAQGAIVAEAAGNVWAAVGVAAEEVAQEGFEWFGGGYAFNRFYAPVILEGDLYSGATGKNVWGRWLVITENKKAVKKLPKPEQKKKEVRLLLTFDKACDAMVRGLEKAALKNEQTSGQASAVVPTIR